MTHRYSFGTVVASVLATWLVTLVLFTVAGTLLGYYDAVQAKTALAAKGYLAYFGRALLLLGLFTVPLALVLVFVRFLAWGYGRLTAGWLAWEYGLLLAGLALAVVEAVHYAPTWVSLWTQGVETLLAALAAGVGQLTAARVLQQAQSKPREATK